MARVSGKVRSFNRVTKVGGGSMISFTACSASAPSMSIHLKSTISELSICTARSPAVVARKNQVAKRFGWPSGVVQWDKAASLSPSSARPVSSCASRRAARLATANSSSSPTASAASTLPPGNTHAPPWKAILALRLTSRISSAAAPSQAMTTDADGIGIGSDILALLCLWSANGIKRGLRLTAGLQYRGGDAAWSTTMFDVVSSAFIVTGPAIVALGAVFPTALKIGERSGGSARSIVDSRCRQLRQNVAFSRHIRDVNLRVPPILIATQFRVTVRLKARDWR